MQNSRLTALMGVLSFAVLCACDACQANGGSGTSERDTSEKAGDSPRPNDGDAGDGGTVPLSAALPEVSVAVAMKELQFERPLAVRPYPGTDGHYVVLEQRGVAWHAYPDGGTWKRTKLFDIQPRVRRVHNEEGLLSFAFHPDYPKPREIFAYYSASSPRRTVLSRYPGPGEPRGTIDPAAEEVLLEVEQPWGNHNGSTLLFGPEGYLYLSLGDGGAGGDPRGNGQDLGTLLGAILRIDVDETSDERPYGIPPDNPFVDREGARPEIWAYGLRNVWRMSFDRETGRLWAADVGQDAWEEVDVIERGGNYGWNVWEGRHRFEEGSVEGEHIEPVAEYGHERGKSITGGYVYRGDDIAELQGAYVYADYVSGRMWALRYADGQVGANDVIAETDLAISSFGRAHDGELLLTAFDGRVYRMTSK